MAYDQAGYTQGPTHSVPQGLADGDYTQRKVTITVTDEPFVRSTPR